MSAERCTAQLMSWDRLEAESTRGTYFSEADRSIYVYVYMFFLSLNLSSPSFTWMSAIPPILGAFSLPRLHRVGLLKL